MSLMYFLRGVLFVSVAEYTETTSGTCFGKSGTITCCSGYRKDSNNGTCIRCDAGYYGKNCSRKCPYPSFGVGCQSLCECSVNLCDIVSGCVTQDLTSSIINTTIFSLSFTTAYLVNTDMDYNINTRIIQGNSKNGSKFKYSQLKIHVALGCIALIALVVVVILCTMRLKNWFSKSCSKAKKCPIYDDLAALNDTEGHYNVLGPERIYEGGEQISIHYSCHDKTYLVKMATNVSDFDSRIIETSQAQNTKPDIGDADYGQNFVPMESHYESTSVTENEGNTFWR